MPELSFAIILSSFIAGILMFLAPCTLPLIPAYIAFIGGQNENDLKKDRVSDIQRSRVHKSALAFVLGFSIIFILLGLLSGLAGSYVIGFKSALTHVAGVFILFFGLSMLGFFATIPSIKNIFSRLPLFSKLTTTKNAFFVGVAFALGWTPCIGPILATVLLFASFSATAMQGALLLAVFSVGFSLPFFLVAYAFGFMSELIYRYSFISRIINIFGGVVLVLIGLLLITSHFDLVLLYGTEVFEHLGFSKLFSFF